MMLAVPNEAAAQTAHPQSAADIRVPVSEARDIEPNSVRFSAAQFTEDAPTVVLLGGNRTNWPKIRDALRQAVFEGYAVRAIFIGPVDAPPSLEIYAKGHHVTRPIDPNEISGPELTELVRDVVREYYR
ncbi:hypothetical protein [Stakelama tenebrarum]|uniref:Uncharacterized protein n=1 Tax=Stakelama tenebrarum TaxID=2711215 RepID=A0A6G6Y4R5_9SPHN|nr:hypothetical protein [Sphingosinithalassobacter tenebrarum]QIG79944.1 hypothetical protein G5C33_09250 [Sphingosinithalassobacter tenebrarum]